MNLDILDRVVIGNSLLHRLVSATGTRADDIVAGVINSTKFLFLLAAPVGIILLHVGNYTWLPLSLLPESG